MIASSGAFGQQVDVFHGAPYLHEFGSSSASYSAGWPQRLPDCPPVRWWLQPVVARFPRRKRRSFTEIKILGKAFSSFHPLMIYSSIPMIRQFQFSIKQKIPESFKDRGDDKTRPPGPCSRRGDPLDLFGRSFPSPSGRFRFGVNLQFLCGGDAGGRIAAGRISADRSTPFVGILILLPPDTALRQFSS